MKTCILCGEATKLDSNDFCEECFNSSIEELGARYERKRASATGKDHQKARSQEDSYESPRPI